jgi:uncharacterized Zn finger protein
MKISKPILLLANQRWSAFYPCPACRHGDWSNNIWHSQGTDDGWSVRCLNCGSVFVENLRKHRIRPARRK